MNTYCSSLPVPMHKNNRILPQHTARRNESLNIHLVGEDLSAITGECIIPADVKIRSLMGGRCRCYVYGTCCQKGKES